MMSWTLNNWAVEAVVCITVGFIIAQLLCVLAKFMNRDN